MAAAVFHARGLTEVGDDLDEVATASATQLGSHANIALRHRAARLRAVLVERRHARRPGRDAGLHPPPDPALPAPCRDDGAGARRSSRSASTRHARSCSARSSSRSGSRSRSSRSLLFCRDRGADGRARQPPRDDRRRGLHHGADRLAQRLPARADAHLSTSRVRRRPHPQAVTRLDEARGRRIRPRRTSQRCPRGSRRPRRSSRRPRSPRSAPVSRAASAPRRIATRVRAETRTRGRAV